MAEIERFEFIGIPSGDCECFVFAVDYDTFKQVTGREPNKIHDGSHALEGMYQLYPNDLISSNVLKNEPLKITMAVERMGV